MGWRWGASAASACPTATAFPYTLLGCPRGCQTLVHKGGGVIIGPLVSVSQDSRRWDMDSHGENVVPAAVIAQVLLLA